jgi:hypothetical protein
MKSIAVELGSPMSLPVHPHLCYPPQHGLAGQKLRAAGVVGGRPVWPVMGGSGEGDNTDEGGADGSDKDGDDKGSGGSGDDASGKGNGKSEGGDANAKIAALQAEKDRHYKLRMEAEKRATEAEKFKKDLEDKDKSELEKATSELAELQKSTGSLQSENEKLRLEVAFLKDNSHKWQNPARALQLADLSGVTIEDGKVVGLDKALTALAKSDPYLLKNADDEDEDNDKGGPTGQQHNRNKGSGKGGADKAALAKKYPALRGR